jgi:chromosome segregation ATPase
MASNSTLKLFKDASDSIYKATPYEASEIDYNIEKCFQFPILKPKIKLDEKKSFKGNEGNNGTDNVTTKNTELFDSYRRFKYLFEKINLENDFKAKSIYLDLYLKVVTPKKQIKDKLDELIKAIKENNNTLSKENESMRTELNNTKIQLVNTQNELTNTRSELANTKNELLKTNQNVEKLIRYIQQKDPKFKIENI